MSYCASCGMQLGDHSSLCPHHHAGNDENWAEGNRIICNFLHRKVQPDRLPADKRSMFWEPPIETEQWSG